jgi:hypothetical protein
MQTARAYLRDQLVPLLPKTWKFYHYFTNLDVQTKTVAMLLLDSVERSPANPQGAHIITYTLELREPQTDLIFALDEVPGLWWTDATRVLHGTEGNQSLSFDIKLHLLANKNTETEA